MNGGWCGQVSQCGMIHFEQKSNVNAAPMHSLSPDQPSVPKLNVFR